MPFKKYNSEVVNTGHRASLGEIEHSTCCCGYVQVNGRIVALAFDHQSRLIFWSDIDIMTRGVYKARVSWDQLINAELIVSHGKF